MGAANAADMAVKAPPPPPAPIPAYFNWTGFYVGGNVGGGWANDSFSGTTTVGGVPSTFSGSDSYSGVVGGGQIGANYQFPSNWVIGIEADVDWTSLSGSTSVCTVPAGLASSGCASDNTKINDFGTVRGRLGYAVNNMLFYGTGGWAWSNISTTSTLTCAGAGCPGTSVAFTGGGSSASATPSGWVAGAGVEWAFNRNWTLRVEYLHLQFSGIGENFSTTVGGIPSISASSASSNDDVVRVGINYLFH
jgi:outer membrane immunogenic protein